MEIQNNFTAEEDSRMSRICQEIMQCMSHLEAGAHSDVSARFSFPKNFVGFQGHFENNPVLPGICKILAVLAMYEKKTGQTLRMSEVSQAKYFMPVTCDQEIEIKCTSQVLADGLLGVKAVIQREENKIAMLQLILKNVSL